RLPRRVARPVSAAGPPPPGAGEAPAESAPIPATVVAHTPPVPSSAAGIEKALIAHGLSPQLAGDVVNEAVMHGLPFATPRALKKLVRSALSRRIAALSRPGDKPPRIAFVGAGGAGRTTATAHTAQACAAAHVDVLVIARRPPDGGAPPPPQPEPLGIPVIAAADATEAKRRLGRRDAGIVFIDTPPIGLGDRQTAV